MTALLLVVAVTMYWCFVEYDVVKKKYTNSSSITKRAKRNNSWLALTTAF